MLITASKARINLNNHGAREPLVSFKTLEEMIKISSLLGAESLTVWILKKNCAKWNKKLRDAGYDLKTYYPKSLPDSAMLDIYWNLAEFIKLNSSQEIDL